MEKLRIDLLPPDPNELVPEKLSFRDLERDATWVAHLLVEYTTADVCEKIVSQEGYDVDAMNVCITIDGVQITHAAFDAIVSEFSGRMLKERLKRVKFDDFDAAVKQRAHEMVKAIYKDLEEKSHELSMAMERLTDTSTSMIEQHWDQLYKKP